MGWKEIENAGGVAFVSGAASGVGKAAADELAARGFDLFMVDRDADALRAAAQDIESKGGRVQSLVLDVSDAAAMDKAAEAAFAMGPVAVVMNNAGIGIPSSCWQDAEAWRKTFNVNFFGVLNGIQAFTERLIEAKRPAAIVNTGSKQGITTPPGNPAYNASKAAVKVLTEQLAHELREANLPIDVHLFVPGFTYTGMIAAVMPEKPPGAWTSAQTVQYLFDEMAKGTFYVLCPDNMVTEEIDARRVLWSAGDIAERRPPLSRWHKDFKDAFAAFEKAT